MTLDIRRHWPAADHRPTPPTGPAHDGRRPSAATRGSGAARLGGWCASSVYFADIDEATTTCALRSGLAVLHRYAAYLVSLGEGGAVGDSLVELGLLRQDIRRLLDGLGTVASADVGRRLAALEPALDAAGARPAEARSAILASRSLVFALLDGFGAVGPEILHMIAEDGTPARRGSADLWQRRMNQQALAGYLDHLAKLRAAFAVAAGVPVRPCPSGTRRPHEGAMAADMAALRDQFDKAVRIVSARRDKATERQETAGLTDALAGIHRQIALLDRHGDLAAVVAVASVAAALQDSLNAGPQHPSGELRSFLGQTEHCLDRLGLLHRDMRAALALMPDSAPPPAGNAESAAVSASLRFSDIAAEYEKMFADCVIRSERAALVQQALDLLRHDRVRYAGAARQLGDVPWHFVGIAHALEAAFDFSGQALADWEPAAQAALRSLLRDSEGDFSLPRVLYVFEQFDGFGYRRSGRASPYVWAFSTYCEHGMPNRSDRFESCPVGRQAGAAVLLKALQQAGESIV